MIENLQPAEALSVLRPDVAIVYTAGQFGDDSAALLGELAAQCAGIFVIGDADLGGARITRRVLTAAPHARLVDVGDWPHPTRAPFPSGGSSARGLQALLDDRHVGTFADAILCRGYPVEQELATLDIIEQLIPAPPPQTAPI